MPTALPELTNHNMNVCKIGMDAMSQRKKSMAQLVGGLREVASVTKQIDLLKKSRCGKENANNSARGNGNLSYRGYYYPASHRLNAGGASSGVNAQNEKQRKNILNSSLSARNYTNNNYNYVTSRYRQINNKQQRQTDYGNIAPVSPNSLPKYMKNPNKMTTIATEKNKVLPVTKNVRIESPKIQNTFSIISKDPTKDNANPKLNPQIDVKKEIINRFGRIEKYGIKMIPQEMTKVTEKRKINMPIAENGTIEPPPVFRLNVDMSKIAKRQRLLESRYRRPSNELKKAAKRIIELNQKEKKEKEKVKEKEKEKKEKEMKEKEMKEKEKKEKEKKEKEKKEKEKKEKEKGLTKVQNQLEQKAEVVRKQNVWKAAPFIPKKLPQAKVDDQPFKLHSNQRVEDRRKFNERMQELMIMKRKREDILRKKKENKLSKEIRKMTNFKAQPNPFKYHKNLLHY